jgi:hypothetical protein
LRHLFQYLPVDELQPFVLAEHAFVERPVIFFPRPKTRIWKGDGHAYIISLPSPQPYPALTNRSLLFRHGLL